jgi:hypothetical protein
VVSGAGVGSEGLVRDFFEPVVGEIMSDIALKTHFVIRYGDQSRVMPAY